MLKALVLALEPLGAISIGGGHGGASTAVAEARDERWTMKNIFSDAFLSGWVAD